MPRHNVWILIAVFSLFASACAGSGNPGAGVLDVSGIVNSQSGADGNAPDQTSPVMDVGNPDAGGDTAEPGEKLDQSRLRECPIDALILKRDYANAAYGVHIAYPAGWEISEDEQGDSVRFTSPNGFQSVAAAFVISETPFEEFVAEAKDPTIRLDPFPADGFTWSLRGTQQDGKLRSFEQYTGKDTERGTLIVVLNGRVANSCSPWLTSNSISESPVGLQLQLNNVPAERARLDPIDAAPAERAPSAARAQGVPAGFNLSKPFNQNVSDITRQPVKIPNALR